MESSAPGFPQAIYREELGNPEQPHRCQLCGEKNLTSQDRNFKNCDGTKMVFEQACTSFRIPKHEISCGVKGTSKSSPSVCEQET